MPTRTYDSALEQAVISKRKEFLFKFLQMQEDLQREMVERIAEELLIPLLEVLAQFVEEKEMRYEAVTMIKKAIIWRKQAFRRISVKVKDEAGNSQYNEQIDRLKKVLFLITKDRLDLNKIYELKGRIEYVKETIDQRETEQENVPVCLEE
ncbi:hypothetical protein NEFER03_1398 [Nematocida sp. LUAm3]|nr:hypothetical protein NEFER03_1398 [Nematocida sp. LUAm3]KAI5174772.1 hypothetical protein NEFER02_0882 [Nematocida sp. LUAm2]KAI5177817.1 hypothetical protein NEFER01_1019 [Nematocida sp. LUAm1]